MSCHIDVQILRTKFTLERLFTIHTSLITRMKAKSKVKASTNSHILCLASLVCIERLLTLLENMFFILVIDAFLHRLSRVVVTRCRWNTTTVERPMLNSDILHQLYILRRVGLQTCLRISDFYIGCILNRRRFLSYDEAFNIDHSNNRCRMLDILQIRGNQVWFPKSLSNLEVISNLI